MLCNFAASLFQKLKETQYLDDQELDYNIFNEAIILVEESYIILS